MLGVGIGAHTAPLGVSSYLGLSMDQAGAATANSGGVFGPIGQVSLGKSVLILSQSILNLNKSKRFFFSFISCSSTYDWNNDRKKCSGQIQNWTILKKFLCIVLHNFSYSFFFQVQHHQHPEQI